MCIRDRSKGSSEEKKWRLLGGCWASKRPLRGPGGAPERLQDGPKGPAKRPQEQAPGRQLAPPRRDGKTTARSAHGKTSARGARETASPETPETREIYHETTRPRTPRQMYLFRRSTGARKTREMYRWATTQTRQPRRPTDAPTAFSDSAFRFLSRQVWGPGWADLVIFPASFPGAFAKSCKSKKT